jgi:hypothetical protein
MSRTFSCLRLSSMRLAAGPRQWPPSGGELHGRRRIEAAANYLRLPIGAEAQLVWETMSGLEAPLDPHDASPQLSPAPKRQVNLDRSYRHKLQELFGMAV